MAAAVQITPAELSAEPGGEVFASVTVTNIDRIVERYGFELLGLPGGATFEPPNVSIYPGNDGTTELRIAIPADAAPGPLPVAVRVTGETSGETVVEEATLVVGGRAAVVGELRPKTSTTRRKARHVVYLTNRGNTAADVVLDADDQDELLTFAMPAQAHLEPGEEQGVPLRVRIERKPDRGERFAFTVTYDDGTGPQVLDGAVRGTRAGRWPLIAGVAALLALVVAFALLGGGDADTTAEQIGTSTSTGPVVPTDPGATTTPTSGPTDTNPNPDSTVVTSPTTGPALTTTTSVHRVTTTSTLPPVVRSHREAADRLLAAWSRGDYADAARYATPTVVEQLKTHMASPGQVSTGASPAGREVIVTFTPCDATKRGLVNARFPSGGDAQYVATQVAFCSDT